MLTYTDSSDVVDPRSGRRFRPQLLLPVALAALLLAVFGPTTPAFSLPARVLDGTIADPVVGPEHPVTTGTASFEPDIAFDGTNYLVVWADQDDPMAPESEIHGMRMTPTGTPLDGSGFRITDQPADARGWPSVSFDGSNFFVVWRSTGSTCAPGACILGARVDPSGTVLDASGIALTEGQGNEVVQPDVAFDGTDNLVVYAGSTIAKPDYDITAVRVAPDGTVGAPFTVGLMPGEQVSPVVASTGSGESLVVWVDDDPAEGLYSHGDIYSSRVDSSGSLDPTGVVVSAEARGQTAPSVAWNGRRYLVAWSDARQSTGEYVWELVHGSRVTRENEVQDPAGIPISSGGVYGMPPSVAANGRTFLVAWSAPGHDVKATRVNDEGVLLDGDGFDLAPGGDADNDLPAVTAGPGSTWGVVYTHSDFFGLIHGQIRMRTVSPK